MTALGLVMMVATVLSYLFVRLFKNQSPWYQNHKDYLIYSICFVCFLLNFLVSDLVIEANRDSADISLPRDTFPSLYIDVHSISDVLVRLWLIPGTLSNFTLIYPIIPWLGITLLGFGWGFFLKENAKKGVWRAFRVQGRVRWVDVCYTRCLFL